ncbi:MAG: methyltransferase domain-containing protein [Chromatiaceae bacterium]|nr:methyltransferase domain-containing protein [Chromatiaceae bacterium]
MSDHQSILEQVQRYYGETLTSSTDLRTDACCDGDAVPEALKPLLADIHPEVSERYYGCGLVAPDALEGLRVLDLGCGAGRDVYLLSRLVGEQGEVVGVDMTAAQLAVAERHRAYHAKRYGYARSNVRFVEGRIEALGALGLPVAGFDLIVSNCVLNLSPDKAAVLAGAYQLLAPGGEFYFADVYADRRLPAALAEDPVLYGECLAGALYWADFLSLARAAGFTDPRLVDARPLAIDDTQVAEKVAPACFRSATYRLFKVEGLDPGAEDDGQTVIYRGDLPGYPDSWSLDRDRRFPTGHAVAVSANSYRILQASRFSRAFAFDAGAGAHRGPFPGVSDANPFTTAIACMTGSCC